MEPVEGRLYRVTGKSSYHCFDIGEVVEYISKSVVFINQGIFQRQNTTTNQWLYFSDIEEIEVESNLKPKETVEQPVLYKDIRLGQIVILKSTGEVGSITHIDRGPGKKNTKEVLYCHVLMNATDAKLCVKPDEIEPIDIKSTISVKDSELAQSTLPSLAAESANYVPAEGTLHTVSVAFLDDRTLKQSASKIYSFNTTADVKEGDIICLPVFRHGKDKAYIIIKRVFNKAFSFVNITNGDFYNENVNCNLMEIKTLEIQEFPKDVVAGIKIQK